MIMFEHKLVSSAGSSCELLSLYYAIYFRPTNKPNCSKTTLAVVCWTLLVCFDYGLSEIVYIYNGFLIFINNEHKFCCLSVCLDDLEPL